MKKIFLISLCFFMLYLSLPVCASDVTPVEWYKNEKDPDIPKTLYVGYTLDCGNYTFSIVTQPVLGRYTNNLISDNDLEYLMIRVELKNNTDKTLAWLSSDSFKLVDVYRGRMYNSYPLDITATAVAAQGARQQVYIEEIGPDESMFTTLVFSVYPDVDGWIMYFSPHTYYEEDPVDEVSFLLPKVNHYEVEY